MRIWRCEQCGKWSHAVTRPRWHRRWVTEQPGHEVPTFRADLRYLGPETSSGCHWEIACGPFVAYEAVRVEVVPPPSRWRPPFGTRPGDEVPELFSTPEDPFAPPF